MELVKFIFRKSKMTKFCNLTFDFNSDFDYACNFDLYFHFDSNVDFDFNFQSKKGNKINKGKQIKFRVSHNQSQNRIEIQNKSQNQNGIESQSQFTESHPNFKFFILLKRMDLDMPLRNLLNF